MVAKSSSDPSSVQKEELSFDLETDLGEDWESAFQAEDYMFSPEEGEQKDFFLSDADQASGYEFAPPSEEDLSSLPDLDPGAPGTPSDHSTTRKDSFTTAADSAGFLPQLGGAWGWFLSLPLLFKLGGTALLLSGLAGVLLVSLQTTPELTGGEESAEQPALFTESSSLAPAEKKERKWRFSPFLVPAPVTGDGARTHFVEVDLTLFLLLEENQPLPVAEKNQIRDTIYSFYQQQSLEDLRRYGLARAEMSRNLLSWLRQHLPEKPVEGVAFNRYQVL